VISVVQLAQAWALIVLAWVMTAAIGAAIYFFPIARLLESLAE
jgi:hypothetical protein